MEPTTTFSKDLCQQQFWCCSFPPFAQGCEAKLKLLLAPVDSWLSPEHQWEKQTTPKIIELCSTECQQTAFFQVHWQKKPLQSPNLPKTDLAKDQRFKNDIHSHLISRISPVFNLNGSILLYVGAFTSGWSMKPILQNLFPKVYRDLSFYLPPQTPPKAFVFGVCRVYSTHGFSIRTVKPANNLQIYCIMSDMKPPLSYYMSFVFFFRIRVETSYFTRLLRCNCRKFCFV